MASGFLKSLTAGAKRAVNATSGFAGGGTAFKKPAPATGGVKGPSRDNSGTRTAVRGIGTLLGGFGKKKKASAFNE